MRYLMKQRLFSFGDDFNIKDEDGKDVFFVDGKALSFGNKLSFQDMQGNELAYIKEEVLSWSPTYAIYRGGELVATVKKELFTFFKCKFYVDVPGPNDLEATGSFSDHDYSFTRNGREVARVSKEWFAFADTYGVEIAENEDDVLILAGAVVIDMACHADRKR